MEIVEAEKELEGQDMPLEIEDLDMMEDAE